MAQVNVNSVNHELSAVVIQGLADREDFVGLRAAPAFGRNNLKSEYPIIKLAEGEMMRDNMEKRVPGSAFKRMDAEVSLDSTKMTAKTMRAIAKHRAYKITSSGNSISTSIMRLTG